MLKLKQDSINTWKKNFDYSLPGLLDAITEFTSGDVFLIGAAIFDIYITEGWVDSFSRQTGDADFTIEYLGDPSEYKNVCEKLLSIGYTNDPVHSYRYHPEEKQGIYAYVDLLAFTTDDDQVERTRGVMRVGDQFHFDGMDFAKLEPLKFIENIFIPNPLTLIYLKLRSYYHNPVDRKKDFVDMLEIILRLATSDLILGDLKLIMDLNQNQEITDKLNSMFFDLEEDRGGHFDLDDIKLDLKERLLDEFELKEIPQTVEFFRMKIMGDN